MRIVLDTAVLVRAHAKSSGPAREVLEQISRGSHTLILSPFLLEETERVLNYPRLQVLYGLEPAEIQEHIDLLTNAAEIVAPVILEPVVPGDPNDDYVVYTAVDGHADILCTRDRHFYVPRVLELCGNHGIAVVGDVELLRLLREE